MRNHSKGDKEKSKPAIRAKTLKKAITYGSNHSVVLKKIKEMANGNDPSLKCAERPVSAREMGTVPSSAPNTTASTQECIILDAGSKKSYHDLTATKANMDPYPRISVIRSIGPHSPIPTIKSDPFDAYQEKPVDFSPKNKYKSEYASNGNKHMPHSTQHTTTMVM